MMIWFHRLLLPTTVYKFAMYTYHTRIGSLTIALRVPHHQAMAAGYVTVLVLSIFEATDDDVVHITLSW